MHRAGNAETPSRVWSRMNKLLRGLALVSCLLMFGCDHASKRVAEATLADRGPVNLIRGLLDLRYAENHDTAFGLLHRFGIEPMPKLLLAVALFTSCVLAAVWYQRRARCTWMQHAGFALVLAGALGNVMDRALRGYVVDFIHVAHWPVFNVADILVVVGVLSLLTGGERTPRLGGAPTS